ncbi:MAG: class I SAM-dependent methyltransferase [Bdellovibrionales bacterium]
MDYTAAISKEYTAGFTEIVSEDFGCALLRQSIAELDRTSCIVDVGCGGGEALASYHEMGFTNLIGIEPSESFRKTASSALKETTTILDGHFEKLPLADASVDALISRYSLHYCPDVGVALAEAARVMKPDAVWASIIGHPDYDQKHADKNTGYVSYTLFNKSVAITYPAHPMDAYIGKNFSTYFDLIKVVPHVSACLDDVPAHEMAAFFFSGKRNHHPHSTQ